MTSGNLPADDIPAAAIPFNGEPALTTMTPRPDRSLDRRHFLKLSSASAIAAAFGGGRLAADDSAALYARMVPANKGLAKDWITSLVKAGHPKDAPLRAVKPGCDLGLTGMTVGGIGCGTVYLAGDGRLFIWDILNQYRVGVVQQDVPIPKGLENIVGGGPQVRTQDGANYVSPPTPDRFPNPFRQHFEITVAGKTRRFQASDWAEVSFDGKWPVGEVRYADPTCPLRVKLTAWTPFIPLNLADSALPVTVMEFEVENPGDRPEKCNLTGVLENPCCRFSRDRAGVRLESKQVGAPGGVMLLHSAVAREQAAVTRPDIPFEDFENGYGAWQREGTAFGDQPVAKSAVPDYQGDLGIHGKAAVNSHASAPGNDVAARDAATGTLTSPEFTISRKFIRLRVGGGNHKGRTCVELLVDGKVAHSITGPANNRMIQAVVPTAEFEGKRARLRLADREQGAWGNIGADEIVFSDDGSDGSDPTKLEDYGTMALALLKTTDPGPAEDALTTSLTVPAGGTAKAVFVLVWHFPNLHPLPGPGRHRRHYAKRFADAREATRWTLANLDRLRADTFGWVKTYYDSSLPRWLLDRAAATSNTLQTNNCYLFENGRFWAWEGVGCCAGTCGHVWHYAQGPARLFPEIERNLRLITDFAIAQNADGAIRFRAEAAGTVAIDSQTGYVLRTWREHLCSADAGFLKLAWPGARKAAEWLLAFDRNGPDGFNGLLHGEQHNTLDAEWYGKVHALCSMYLAALRAAEEMAGVMGDAAFAAECRKAFDLGAKNLSTLFNGEYYIQEEDPKHLGAIGVGTGCYIDQVIGQWWAHQTGLGRISDETQIRSALHSLWKYNFVPDVGPFRGEFKRGRFYAMPGDAGLVMCTWPRGGLRPDFMKHWQYAYFNECMTGFEWQAAAHMIQEGAPVSGQGFEDALENPADPRSLTLRGLAVARAIHDRYAPAKRNPYNEIECSDHYARAAASYSVLLAATGFHHDGPAGVIGFDPKLDPGAFKAPFTVAEGWGTFAQQQAAGEWQADLTITHGRLRLRSIRLPWLGAGYQAVLDGKPLSATARPGVLELAAEAILSAGGKLTIRKS